MLTSSDYDRIENELITLIRQNPSGPETETAQKHLAELIITIGIQFFRDIHDIARCQTGGQ